jgi:membrane associated rhomboid family serine protease
MGTADRDYFRDEEARYTSSGIRPAMPPVTKFLLIANIVIFLIDFFTRSQTSVTPDFGILNYRFCFTVRSALMEGRIWELVTFQFLHATIGHILFNSLGIYFFGPWIERWWGSARFIVFYLLCGAAGALFFTLLTVIGILPERGLLSGVDSPLVGASAGIYGMLAGIAIISPGVMVSLLFPPVTLTIRQLALWVIGIAIFMIVGDILLGGSFFGNSGGEAGHLGGAILGFFLTRYPFLLRKGSSSKIIRPREFRRKNPPKLRPRTEVDVATASEVDRILDKIAKDGLQSLNDKEREILQEAAKSQEDR